MQIDRERTCLSSILVEQYLLIYYYGSYKLNLVNHIKRISKKKPGTERVFNHLLKDQEIEKMNLKVLLQA